MAGFQVVKTGSADQDRDNARRPQPEDLAERSTMRKDDMDAEIELSMAPATPLASEKERRKYPGIGGAIGLLLLAILVQAVLLLGLIGWRWLKHGTIDLTGLVTSLPIFIVTYVVTFVVTLFLGWRLSRDSFREVFRFIPFPGRIIALFVPLLFGLAVILFEIMAGITQVKPVSPYLIELMRRLMEQSVVLALLAGGIVGPLLEEMLFRGLILRGFLDRYRPWQAIALNALLFGLLHLNLWQFFSAFSLGLVLAWLYYRTGSLWPCFILHSMHNTSITFTGTFVYVTLLGYPAEVVDASVVPPLPMWLVVIAGMCVCLCLRKINQWLQKTGLAVTALPLG